MKTAEPKPYKCKIIFRSSDGKMELDLSKRPTAIQVGKLMEFWGSHLVAPEPTQEDPEFQI